MLFDLTAETLHFLGVALLLRCLRRLFTHLRDLFPGEAGRCVDGDLFGHPRPRVLGLDVHDAIGIDAETDPDAGHSLRGGLDVGEFEFAQADVSGGLRVLSLEDVDLDRSLVVHDGTDELTVLGWDRGVLGDEGRETSPRDLDSKREVGDVEQRDALQVSLEDACLDGCADGDDGDAPVGAPTTVASFEGSVTF